MQRICAASAIAGAPTSLWLKRIILGSLDEQIRRRRSTAGASLGFLPDAANAVRQGARVQPGQGAPEVSQDGSQHSVECAAPVFARSPGTEDGSWVDIQPRRALYSSRGGSVCGIRTA